jgi:hypothetical protein
MLRCFVIITLSTGQLSVLTRALVNPVGKHTVFSAVSSGGEDASLHLAGSPTPLLRLLAHLFAGDLVTGGSRVVGPRDSFCCSISQLKGTDRWSWSPGLLEGMFGYTKPLLDWNGLSLNKSYTSPNLFKQRCKACQDPVVSDIDKVDNKSSGISEEVSSLTPPPPSIQIINHQMDGTVDPLGQ